MFLNITVGIGVQVLFSIRANQPERWQEHLSTLAGKKEL